ncbi:HPr family phosphocarrier protein [Lentibacillus saliphilus]|uniref:HPr family phosphocarrier protein n=1 Tax=Lentibacillus saliphilus TaxID=2737028 RepID=UPI001C2FB078|nr:HPr family phosphocarrier protein [Lentibacillus saliphilus]
MIQKDVIVSLKTGLQARPAAQFVREANRYSAHLYIEKDQRQVNAKSIMGIMSLAIATGEKMTLIADGSDEAEALDHLVEFVGK